VGPVEPEGAASAIKRALLSRSHIRNRGEHRVVDVLRLADVIGIPALGDVVCPAPAPRPQLTPTQPYAVIHAAPMFVYKRWTADGWRALAAAVRERGFVVAATGAASDGAHLDAGWRDSRLVRLDGKRDWPELAALTAGARVYIGPDPAITHLAAAAGAPTVALYGPTDPRLWGPWPRGGLEPSWQPAGTIQHRGNVWLVQNPLACLPCQLEGCERRLDSHSPCLDELRVGQVLAAVDQALAVRQAAWQARSRPGRTIPCGSADEERRNGQCLDQSRSQKQPWHRAGRRRAGVRRKFTNKSEQSRRKGIGGLPDCDD